MMELLSASFGGFIYHPHGFEMRKRAYR